ncbi:MAG TPA: hypothetical protein VFA13_10675 [Candidatus Acidoferrum sp.]|jgi:hypothetical protein|nr:hypothetical protein [Candidatus Acidoferrum sp.]
MSLLKPPAPEVTKRKYYIRIDERLAQKMEKYAEFINARTVDYVIAEALDFVFRKDGKFNAWLAQHPGVPPARANGSKPNGSTIAEETDRGTPATASATI